MSFTTEDLVQTKTILDAAYTPRTRASCVDCLNFKWQQVNIRYFRDDVELNGGADCLIGSYTDANPANEVDLRVLFGSANTCHEYAELNAKNAMGGENE